MPIFFQLDIDETTKLGIWKIEEEESFFKVPLQRDITHPHKRLQHLAGRFLLRYLFPQFPLDLIKIADTRKPFLEDEAYHFSISHCGDYAAAIVSTSKRVGVDIEIPTQKVEKIKNKFLHPEELAALDSILSLQREIYVVLTLLWSCKEAVFKWWSYGNVDFSEMIRLECNEIASSGILKSVFITPIQQYTLNIEYILFDPLCLAWIVTDKGDTNASL